jgi:low temperature requirement protein LtrA
MAATRRKLLDRFAARDRHEPHRVATPLELFFDLVAVIAIASAAAGLHHALAEGHALHGIIGFLFAFFGIWWAWMNYTWFASAYDNGDTVFRLLTLVIMAGALIFATGIPVFFAGERLVLGVSGYVVMRLGMVTLWLRAATGDPGHRRTALRYALGIFLVQIYWTLLIVALGDWTWMFMVLFAVGAALELSVPWWAERAGMTTWHRHHIIERYGLLNIIVLGETLLAAVMAIGAAIEVEPMTVRLAGLALAATVTAFALFWVYFAQEDHLGPDADDARAFVWGYGHFLIFASGAAVGAAFALQVDVMTEHAHVGQRTADVAVAVPVAAYLFALWLVRDRFSQTGAARWVLPAGALASLATPLLSHALGWQAALLVACAMLRSVLADPGAEPEAAGPI